jgi:hypothetical protein
MHPIYRWCESIPFEEFCEARARALGYQDRRNNPEKVSRLINEYGGPWGEYVHKKFVEYPTRYTELENHRYGPFVRVAQKRSGPYPPAAYPELAERVAAARAAARAANQQAYKHQLSELFQANASASNETIASALDIKQRVFALQGLTEKIEKEHVVESDDGRMYRQAWALWNTPAEPPVKSAFELTANFKHHSRKIDCFCGFVDVHLDEEHKRIEACLSEQERAQGSTQEQQQQVEEKNAQTQEQKEESSEDDAYVSCDEAPEDDQEPGRLLSPHLLYCQVLTY